MHVVWLKGDYASGHEREAQAREEGCDLVVEFHFNSNGPDAKGCEVHYKEESPASHTIAVDVLPRMVALGFRSRGLVCADAGHRSSWLSHYHCAAVLLEPLFVSNPVEAGWIHDSANVRALAEAVAGPIRNRAADIEIVGLSVGHLYKSSSPTDTGAPCILGDTEADHAKALAMAVAEILLGRPVSGPDS